MQYFNFCLLYKFISCMSNYSSKYAVAAMKRKIYDKNPHVAKFGLIVSIIDFPLRILLI